MVCAIRYSIGKAIGYWAGMTVGDAVGNAVGKRMARAIDHRPRSVSGNPVDSSIGNLNARTVGSMQGTALIGAEILHDDMSIGTTVAKIIHRSSPYAIVIGPWFKLGRHLLKISIQWVARVCNTTHFEIPFVKMNFRIRLLKVDTRRNLAFLERQSNFDDTG